jgi:hypothetical protein
MYDLNEDDGRQLREVLSRSAVDAKFRALLLKDPRTAVKIATGKDLPKELNLSFIEQPKEVDALIVLPAVAEHRDELTPEELEAVAGGICWDTCDNTCKTSCDNTCVVTGLEVAT